MTKLGKKARKFAKKHLQSVLRNRRKNKALFKKKSSKNRNDKVEEQVQNPVVRSNGRSDDAESIQEISLDAVFAENDFDDVKEFSDSDGYLSEDSGLQCFMEIKDSTTIKDEITTGIYSLQNKKMYADLSIYEAKLEKLRKKDPKFSKLLESFAKSDESYQNGDALSDDGELSDQADPSDFDLSKAKLLTLTNQKVTTWHCMVKEDRDEAALVNLLNAFRAACHYGAEAAVYRIENCETFYNILHSTLSSAPDSFLALFQISSSKSGKEVLFQLSKASKWKSLRPLVKSFVRSTLFLLNQVTDRDILRFVLTNLRAALVFFAAFPLLIPPLVKVCVHLWATRDETLSSASFSILRDLVVVFGSIDLETCLGKMFRAFLSRSRAAQISDVASIQFLRDCLVQLCSVDLQKSSLKVSASTNQISKLLSWGLKTKKKEAIRRLCSFEYVNCIDLWVSFIAAYMTDCDVKYAYFMIIRVINGVALMFPGPRYFPLRLRCIEWLNNLSRSSGNFIPVTSIVLDIFEYKFVKEGKKAESCVDMSSVLKVPKRYLKSKTFQEECFRCAVEQMSFHFSQWSFHISFPDLAAIPLVRLNRALETTTCESLRRMVKRLIVQVEQNAEFVQKKRDEIAVSPSDHQSADMFLQLEKPSLNAAFTQYYRSVTDNATRRKKVQTKTPE